MRRPKNSSPSGSRSLPAGLTLDVSLPGLSGRELQKRAAVDASHPNHFSYRQHHIPTTVQAMKAGAVEFLIKPFRDNELLRAVREALERSRLFLLKRRRNKPFRNVMHLFQPANGRSWCCILRVDQQAGRRRTRHQRNYGESIPRPVMKMHADSFADLVKWQGLGLAERREATMACDHADLRLTQAVISLEASHSCPRLEYPIARWGSFIVASYSDRYSSIVRATHIAWHRPGVTRLPKDF